MIKFGLHWALAVAIALASMTVAANPLPQELRQNLPGASLGGHARFTFLGFDLYDARLWAEPGFTTERYDLHPFALELTYLRDFTGESIADRSVVEMRRQPGATEAQFDTWKRWMRSAFPNVRKGDRITGLHRPGEGALFLVNGLPVGALRDADFSRRFFGIWLSAQTSDSRLREILLLQVAPR